MNVHIIRKPLLLALAILTTAATAPLAGTSSRSATTIQGTVVNSVTGKPVREAKVFLWRNRKIKTKTGRNGDFTLETHSDKKNLEMAITAPKYWARRTYVNTTCLGESTAQVIDVLPKGDGFDIGVWDFLVRGVTSNTRSPRVPGPFSIPKFRIFEKRVVLNLGRTELTVTDKLIDPRFRSLLVRYVTELLPQLLQMPVPPPEFVDPVAESAISTDSLEIRGVVYVAEDDVAFFGADGVRWVQGVFAGGWQTYGQEHKAAPYWKLANASRYANGVSTLRGDCDVLRELTGDSTYVCNGGTLTALDRLYGPLAFARSSGNRMVSRRWRDVDMPQNSCERWHTS